MRTILFVLLAILLVACTTEGGFDDDSFFVEEDGKASYLGWLEDGEPEKGVSAEPGSYIRMAFDPVDADGMSPVKTCLYGQINARLGKVKSSCSSELVFVHPDGTFETQIVVKKIIKKSVEGTLLEDGELLDLTVQSLGWLELDRCRRSSCNDLL